MDPTNELFQCIWEIVESNLTENKKIETAERLFSMIDDFGADTDTLKELADEDKFLEQALDIAFPNYEEDEDEYSYEDEKEDY